MARWRFVHREDGIVIVAEADTWGEALGKIGRGKVIHSNLNSTKLPPGIWEVSEELTEQPPVFHWRFVYRSNEISATVEAATVEEAAAKLLAGEVIDLEINPMGLLSELWDLVKGPIIPPEVVATLKAHFSAPTPEFWEWVKEFTGKLEETPK